MQVLDKGYVELINSMGNDLSVVNAARVSFNKTKHEFDKSDEKLIKYLIKHRHFSPFRGVVFQFRVKAPLYITAQWYKHAVASSYVDSQNQWNQTSLRYTDIKEADFYIPDSFRCQSQDNRQASEGIIDHNDKAREVYEAACLNLIESYHYLRELGVCREQARGIIPPALYTEFIWTTSLQALLNFLSLRDSDDAQSEIADYARAIRSLVEPIVPITMNNYKG